MSTNDEKTAEPEVKSIALLAYRAREQARNERDEDYWPETNEEADRLAELDSERAEARRDDDMSDDDEY